ncbi:YgjV family protein [Candidatus Saccharibacteria bacterium]|nr:YgjV family protein [Candidatus Saccharibacteria bacterium]
MNIALAQILALYSSLCLLISFWQKKRKDILNLQILDSVFDIVQYILLGAYTGCLISFLGATRACVFKKAKNGAVLLLFIALYIAASILTFRGWLSLLPLTAAIIYTIVIWNKKEQNIRFFSIFVFLLWLVYDIFVQAYVSAITDIVLVASNAAAFYKYNSKEKSK